MSISEERLSFSFLFSLERLTDLMATKVRVFYTARDPEPLVICRPPGIDDGDGYLLTV